MNRSRRVAITMIVMCVVSAATGAGGGGTEAPPACNGLVGHWPLCGDCRDDSGNGLHAVNHGVRLEEAAFDGRSSYLEIPVGPPRQLGAGDSTLAMSMQSDEVAERPPGDLIGQYDAAERRGFHLTLTSNPGVTSNQANWRHLQFGIDDDRASEWSDCGRPGNATLALALAVHDGTLYVDGKQVARTGAFDAASYSLDTPAPLRIGCGMNGHWNGRLSEVRLYRRALSPVEIETLAHPRPDQGG